MIKDTTRKPDIHSKDSKIFSVLSVWWAQLYLTGILTNQPSLIYTLPRSENRDHHPEHSSFSEYRSMRLDINLSLSLVRKQMY